jgi:hypothetical protein
MRKVDKMQKRGKLVSKYFERPEGTHEDVAVPAASSSINHFHPFSMGENMLAISDVARTGKEACRNMQKHAERSRERRKTRKTTGAQNADYRMAAHGAEHADSYSPSRSLHSCIDVVNGANMQSLLISSAHLGDVARF